MAVLAIAAVGAMAGSAALGTATFLGMTGAQLGWMAGSMLGNALVNRQHTKGPQLDDKRVVGVDYGAALPWVAGAPRIAGTLAWGSDFREIANTEEVGKGGGSSYTSYTYEMDALFIVADQPGATVTRIFSAGKLVWTGLASADDESRIASEGTTLWRRLTVYQGGESQFPDPVYEAAVSNAPAYRGRTCVFFEGLQLGASGVLPNFTFEVASDASDSTTMVRRTAIADVLGSGSDQAALEAGLPLIRRMTPTVAVELPDGADKFGFTSEGADVGWPGGYSPIAIPVQVPGETLVVGIIDGQVVRRQNSIYATGTGRVLLSVGATNGLVNDSLPDLAAPLPAGRYLVSAFMCSDGDHAMLLTATTGSGASATEYWIVSRKDSATRLVRTGDATGSNHQVGFGSGGNGDGSAGMLEENLRHLWSCRGYGTGEVSLSYINEDGDLVAGTMLQSGAGLLQYSFTYPTGWAEAGFFVVVNKGDFHTFRREGSTINDVTLRSTVEALCQRATMPAGTYDASALASITRPVRALAVESGSVRQAIEVLMASHAFDAYVTDKLYFRPRGGAVVATIPREDLAAGEGDAAEEPFALQVGADLEIPNRVAVTYRNMQADQQSATEHSDRGPSGQDSLQSVQIAVGLLPTEAKGVADGLVLDGFASRLTSDISLPLGYSHLVPTDPIGVPDEDGTLYRMRIVRRNEQGGVLSFELVGEDGHALAVPAPTSEGYVAKTSVADTGETILHVLDIPLLRDTDDGPGVYVAARGTTTAWPGCSVMVSTNGTSFTSVAEIGEAATLGTATSLLAAGPTDIMDTANTVTVNVGHGQLSSMSRAALFADPAANVMLLGAEVLRFQTATLVTASPNVYRLSGLLRGQRGTEWAVGTHAINERAVLLQARGLRRVTLALADIGRELSWKGVTRGQLVDAVPSQTATVAGVSQQPLAPVDLRATRDSTGGMVFNWKRRTRLLPGTLGTAPALGEASEAYDVEILSGAAVIRTTRVTEAQFSYPESMQRQDFGAVQGAVSVRVYQIGALGRGQVLAGTAGGAAGAIVSTTITLGGTFTAGIRLRVTAGALLLAEHTVAAGDSSLSGVATALAAKINSTAGYTASAAGLAINVSGPAGVSYTLAVDVSGGSGFGHNLLQTAAYAGPGASWVADVSVTNTITGVTEPVPAGTVLGFSIERSGANLGAVSYTLPATGSRMDALQGLASAFMSSALFTAGYRLAVSSGTAGPFARLSGPVGVIDNLFRPAAGGAFGLAASVQAAGAEAVAADRPQISDFTAFGTVTAGEVFRLTLGGTDFSHTAIGGDTPASVAAALAALVDASPSFAAAATDRGFGATADTVRVTGGTAGVPFTYAQTIVRAITATIT